MKAKWLIRSQNVRSVIIEPMKHKGLLQFHSKIIKKKEYRSRISMVSHVNLLIKHLRVRK